MIRGVAVTLTAEAAQALNQVFGISDFFEGFEIGEANLRTFVRRPGEREDREEDDGD